MQGSKFNQQGTGMAKGCLALNFVLGSSLMPAHICATLNCRLALTCIRRVLSETAGGFHSDSQSMGNKEERHFTSSFNLLLYL